MSTDGGSRSSTPGCTPTIGERLKAVEPISATTRVPRDLRRRAHRRAARRDDRRVPTNPGSGSRCSCPCSRSSTPSSSRTTDGRRHRCRRPERLRRPHQRRLLRLQARDPRRIEPGDELVEETFAPDPERRAHRVPLRGLFRPDGHDQGRQRLETLSRVRQGTLARSSGAVLGECARAVLMLAFSLSGGREPLPRRARGSAATPTTSRSGAAATLLGLARGAARARGDMGRARCEGRARAEARAQRRGLPRPECCERRVVVHEFRDGFMPYVGGEP